MARIQVRRGTAAQWTTTNPTLTSGEPGFETDTGFVKWGNGLQAWNDLPYSEADESAAIAALDTRLATVESGRPVGLSGTAITAIVYDAAGNVTSITEGGVTTTYTYDADGNVATETRLGVTRTYAYADGVLTGASVA